MQTKDILKELRKSKGYSNAKDFCEDIGISFNTYQNYETGKRTPTAEVLIKLADFYDVTTDYLLGREPKQEPKQPEVDLLDMLNLPPEVKTVLRLYIGVSPEARKEIVEIARTTGTDIKSFIDKVGMLMAEHPSEQQQTTMVPVETAGEFKERKKREAEAEAQRKETG